MQKFLHNWRSIIHIKIIVTLMRNLSFGFCFLLYMFIIFFLLFFLHMQDNEQQIAEMKKISSFFFFYYKLVLNLFVNENGPKTSKTTFSIEVCFFMYILNTFYRNPRTRICLMVLLGTQKL